MLQIENTGPGYIGEIGDDWSITMPTTPPNVGMRGGMLGSMNFTARCDATTKFTIDNYLNVKHFYDDELTRWLSTFDVYIREVETDNEFGEFAAASPLAGLDVERKMSLDAAGTYHRTITLPKQVAYVVNGTTYYTGGTYNAVGSETVWTESSIAVYDIGVRSDFIYVLAQGTHNGEVVFRFYVDGTFQAVWPVYSDATDVANPFSRHMFVGSSQIFIGQSGADRVKVFSLTGTFQSQFGSVGSGNGQFQTISGISGSTQFNSIFVSDSALGRVQRFNYSGVYQNQWGTSGTGTGNTVFNSPGGIAVDPVSDNLFVPDFNARVRAYDSFGNLQAQPMGAYDFVRSESIGELTKNDKIKVGFDHRGHAYAVQDGRVYMYARTTNSPTSWFYGSQLVKRWEVLNPDRYSYAISTIGVDPECGTVVVGRTTEAVEVYSGTPGSLPSIIMHFIATVTPDFPVQIMAINEPSGKGPYPYIGWEGNVWEHLCELCAVTDNAMAMFDNRLIIFNRADRTFKLPESARISPVAIDSRGAGLNIEITNLNAEWSNVGDVMYDSVADDRRTMSTDLNEFSYYTVEQGTYPQHIFDPIPGSVASPGVYTITGRDDTPIDPDLWARYGGKVIVEQGDRVGTLVIKVVGPMLKPGGIGGPYYLTDSVGTPTLTIKGSGVVTNPEVIRIGTGLSEDVTNVLVADQVESPFVTDAAVAYTEGGWLAHNAGTPDQSVRITIPAEFTYKWASLESGGIGGTFQFANVFIYHDDSEYLVTAVEANSANIVLSAIRYNRTGHAATAVDSPSPRFEEIWNGRTAAELDAFWAEYRASAMTIAPLRNPFGYNARVL